MVLNKLVGWILTNNLTTAGLIILIFLILQLCGIIDWEWKWLFSPILIPIGLFVTIFVVTFVRCVKNNTRH